jgi:aspartate/methionine/tyrosine aminotransferase
MKLEQFAMERMQSTYENQVEFNLSESGVHPLRLGDLVDDDEARRALLDEALRYTQSNGTVALRERIATQYPGTTAANIQVTNGGSEANYITTWNLIDPGDEVVMMVPNYMQTWGLTRAFGGTIREWPLISPAFSAPARHSDTRSTARWQIDFDAIERLVTARTKLIMICNPNNPTGARFDAPALDRIAAVASRYGSWILSDEIYRGAELDGGETASMWGRSDRVIVTNGLSKAYGLPGLRVGWIVGPAHVMESLWSYHDYTTISPGALSDFLARHALEPARRARILARTRRILNENYPLIAAWLDAHGDLFSYAPPDAGAIVYVRYHHSTNSTALVNRLREKKNVLIVPGDHFGMDGHLRLGFGEAPAYLRAALGRLNEGVIAEFGMRIAD